jgi:hypothetical protein
LNLLSVLVPEGLLLEYFSLLMPIKLGFAGLFFALFLKKLFRKDDLSIVLFGAFYALCASKSLDGIVHHGKGAALSACFHRQQGPLQMT